MMDRDLQGTLELDSESLDEIAVFNYEARTRNCRPRQYRYSMRISPSLERIFVRREPKPVVVEQPPTQKTCPPDAPPAPVASAPIEITCYGELINALKEQVGAMGVRYEDFDSLAGWAAGLTGKAFGAAQARRLGPEKMFDAIRAAGMRLRIEIDPEQLDRMKKRATDNFLPRKANQAKTNNQNHLRPSEQLIERVLRYLANNRGGLGRLNGAAKEARTKWAQHANEVRWERDSKVEGPQEAEACR
jgi:hypothetical protein